MGIYPEGGNNNQVDDDLPADHQIPVALVIEEPRAKDL